MKYHEIDAVLASSLDDLRLSRAERKALDQIFAETAEGIDFDVIRSRAFSLARNSLKDREDRLVVEWLEGVVKVLQAARKPSDETDRVEAWFSPGTQCRDRLVAFLNRAAQSVDVCVFTITDDTLSRTILEAHRRGVKVRVITDDQKTSDLGSDAAELAKFGVAVVTDASAAHMHHKFAIVDRKVVVTGSFNWTRSASFENHENIVVLDNLNVVRRFEMEFERLWRVFLRS